MRAVERPRAAQAVKLVDARAAQLQQRNGAKVVLARLGSVARQHHQQKVARGHGDLHRVQRRQLLETGRCGQARRVVDVLVDAHGRVAEQQCHGGSVGCRRREGYVTCRRRLGEGVGSHGRGHVDLGERCDKDVCTVNDGHRGWVARVDGTIGQDVRRDFHGQQRPGRADVQPQRDLAVPRPGGRGVGKDERLLEVPVVVGRGPQLQLCRAVVGLGGKHEQHGRGRVVDDVEYACVRRDAQGKLVVAEAVALEEDDVPATRAALRGSDEVAGRAPVQRGLQQGHGLAGRVQDALAREHAQHSSRLVALVHGANDEVLAVAAPGNARCVVVVRGEQLIGLEGGREGGSLTGAAVELGLAASPADADGHGLAAGVGAEGRLGEGREVARKADDEGTCRHERRHLAVRAPRHRQHAVLDHTHLFDLGIALAVARRAHRPQSAVARGHGQHAHVAQPVRGDDWCGKARDGPRGLSATAQLQHHAPAHHHE
eukprot:Unigene11828_Nuclearia_a/m.36022 Unigene11828_Nuclearia_a/g.36022  ORF Unigene11828_Nuclearia_a/g.36022 Unigene11828_Nuclearia_a/m.36022 type:complete len:486 (-) Unigene11828_Nuclearia_a:40-1497(-)